MDTGTGDRGVSQVIGFILIFGMLVTAFTVYQGVVVPDQNRQAEFEHNQDVQGQLQDLRNAIVGTAATGSGQAVSVTLGASYPRRAIAQNLGVSAGSVQTTDPGAFRITNVRARNAETADHLGGSVGPLPTKSITYTPVYSFYSNAPNTIYENSLAYNQFDEANLTITDQAVVDGRRITLIAINGSLEEARKETVSVSTEAISTSSNRVAVTNTSSGPITITVPTSLTRSQWLDVLEEERASNGGYVTGVSEVPGREAVNVSLRPGVTYELRMAKVGVGDVTSDEGVEYVTDVAGNTTSVPEGGTQRLVVEVRDRFNNPVSDVSVSSSDAHPAGSVESADSTTGSDGRAAFTFSADPNVDGAVTGTIEVSFDDGSPDRETASFHVDVLDSDGSGGGGGAGGPSNYGIDWSTTSIDDEDGVESCSGNRCVYNLSEDPNSNLPLSAGTSPALAGVFVDFSTNDSSIVGSISPSESRTDASGETTTTVDVDATGTVALFASATEDSDELILEVTQAGTGGGGGGGPNLGPATVTGSYSNVGSGSERESVQFEVQNSGGSAATIEQVGVSVTAHPASGTPHRIRGSGGSAPWNNEVSIRPDAGGSVGVLDSEYTLGDTATLDSPAVIPAGESATVYLSRFQQFNLFPFGWEDVDMRGSTLSVTFHLSNGDTTTITVDVPD